MFQVQQDYVYDLLRVKAYMFVNEFNLLHERFKCYHLVSVVEYSNLAGVDTRLVIVSVPNVKVNCFLSVYCALPQLHCYVEYVSGHCRGYKRSAQIYIFN